MEYGSVVARSSSHDESEVVQLSEVSVNEAVDSESPLASTRGHQADQKGEANQRGNATSQDVDHTSPQVDLYSPQCWPNPPTAGNKSRDIVNLDSFQAKGRLVTSSVWSREEQDKSKPATSSCSKDVTSVARTDHGGQSERKDLPSMGVDFDLRATSDRLNWMNRDKEEKGREEEEDDEKRFRAKINPASNSQAEEELRKQIRYV